MSLLFIIFIIVIALVFDYTNGMHDAANSISTVVSTRVLTPKLAVIWEALSAYTSIGLGTLSGGWRIVKTMGQKITKLEPIDGVCAETSAAFSIFLATPLGIPVSTTHVITGAISGVGSANRFTAVRWGVTFRIVWAWIFTIPVTALLAGLIYLLWGIFGLE